MGDPQEPGNSSTANKAGQTGNTPDITYPRTSQYDTSAHAPGIGDNQGHSANVEYCPPVPQDSNISASRMVTSTSDSPINDGQVRTRPAAGNRSATLSSLLQSTAAATSTSPAVNAPRDERRNTRELQPPLLPGNTSAAGDRLVPVMGASIYPSTMLQTTDEGPNMSGQQQRSLRSSSPMQRADETPTSSGAQESSEKCICNRPFTYVVCTSCGHVEYGHKWLLCPKHGTRVRLLMDLEYCICQSRRLVEATPLDDLSDEQRKDFIRRQRESKK